VSSVSASALPDCRTGTGRWISHHPPEDGFSRQRSIASTRYAALNGFSMVAFGAELSRIETGSRQIFVAFNTPDGSESRMRDIAPA
jgi:hypothetical protein